MIELLGDHLWQSTLFAAAAGLLTLTLRKNRAHVRYWLWLAASVKFLVPFAVLVAIGGLFGWPSSPPMVQSRFAAVADAVGRPFSPPVSPVAVAMTAAHDETAATSIAVAVLAAPLVVWLAGCASLALMWAVRWRRVAEAVRRGSPIDAGRDLRALRRLERVGGSRRPLAVVSCDARFEPGVFGILRPVLLWPQRIMARFADEQVEAILAHELCHVRRRDNLAAAVHALVEALFWFHPLVWWVGARLVAERERACDEDVVRMGSDPSVYAESILKTCQMSVESPRVCVAGVSGSDLKRRIEQILTDEVCVPLNVWRRLLLGTAGAAAIVVPLAIGFLNGPRLRAQAPGLTDGRRAIGSPDAASRQDRRLIPRLNRALGFELLPGRPSRPADDPRGSVAWNVAIDRPSGRMSFVGFTGRGLIRYAYGLADVPVVEGPGWIDTESVEMSATARAATDDDMRSVMRGLLEDRVKLTTHHETRNLPVYALVAARRDGALGPYLRASTSDCVDRSAFFGATLDGRARLLGAARDTGRTPRLCGVQNGITGMTFEKVTITELAEELSRSGPMIDRRIVDRTGLTGTFDATLGLGFLPASIVLTRYPASGALLEPLGVRSIFRALPEQLGLKLDDATMPADVLVIDGAERPSR